MWGGRSERRLQLPGVLTPAAAENTFLPEFPLLRELRTTLGSHSDDTAACARPSSHRTRQAALGSLKTQPRFESRLQGEHGGLAAGLCREVAMLEGEW